MGLDMYFKARKNTFKAFSRYDSEECHNDITNYPQELGQLADYIYNRNYKSASIDEYYQVGYFRKFNALHNYIVANFADGVDECQEILLDKSQAETVLKDLQAVQLDHTKAAKVLPTTRGCFFGSMDYDAWYYDDVDEAIKMFNLILDTLDFETYDLIYQASW